MPCCSSDEPAAPDIAPPESGSNATSWTRRFATLLQWALPVTTLTLMPKCPGCVAGYVLLLTGLGVSVTAASAMRWSLIAISIAALAYLAFRTARRAFAGVTRHA